MSTNVEINIPNGSGSFDTCYPNVSVGNIIEWVRKKNTNYAINDITYNSNLPTGWYLKCTKAGTTSNNDLIINSPALNNTITDGSVNWIIDTNTATQITNSEYLYVMLDSEGHVLFTIKKDGSVDWQKGIPKPIQEKIFTDKIDSEEFVQLTQDTDGKLIEGVKSDGTKVFFSPVLFKNKVICSEDAGNIKDNLDVYSKLLGKRVSVLGDSVSTYNGYSYLNPSYPTGDVNSVTKTWWGQVIEHFGMNLLKDNAIGGSTVTGDSTLTEINGIDTPGCSEFRVNNLAANGVSPDIILIYLGVNDINIRNIANSIGHINQNDGVPTEGEIYDFAKAYDLMLYKIRTRYPNALIFCSALPFHIFGSEFPYNNTKNLSFVAANEAIREACNHMGAFYVDLHSRGTMSGNIHPQLEGMTKIARGFIKKILEVV